MESVDIIFFVGSQLVGFCSIAIMMEIRKNLLINSQVDEKLDAYKVTLAMHTERERD